MQFSERKKRQSILTGKRDPELYPHSLQFYKYAPTDTITLEEFESLALERLKVLRLIERAGAKYNKTAKEYKEMIINELRNQRLSFYYKITKNDSVTDEMYDERRRDHISHFILRLAYCRREDLRRWFIAQEIDLFRLRFATEKVEFRRLFMEQNKLDYKPISTEEKENISTKLCVGSCYSMAKVKNAEFYKVPFTEVLDLVRNRRIYLENGYAYITEDDLVLTVLCAFRQHLSHALAVTSRALPQLEEDTRLISMLNTLHQRYIGTDYSSRKIDYSTGEVAPESIDGYARTSFPLCMRNLHEVLRKNHHLKYNGRLQYGLFLKGIGLTLEDAMRFWREEFTKVMDVDKFDKQYSYNIRYNYGKEGKRANFSPYSCMKIITSNTPGPGEFHGCPFKHSDEHNLRQRLQGLHINSSGINSILDLTSKGHYQIACTRFFELTHQEGAMEQGINHPNQYFEESQKIIKGIKKVEKSSSQNTIQHSSLQNTEVISEKSQPPTNEDFMDDMGSSDDIEEILASLKGV